MISPTLSLCTCRQRPMRRPSLLGSARTKDVVKSADATIIARAQCAFILKFLRKSQWRVRENLLRTEPAVLPSERNQHDDTTYLHDRSALLRTTVGARLGGSAQRLFLAGRRLHSGDRRGGRQTEKAVARPSFLIYIRSHPQGDGGGEDRGLGCQPICGKTHFRPRRKRH